MLYRLTQQRLIALYKDVTPCPLKHLDLLLDECHGALQNAGIGILVSKTMCVSSGVHDATVDEAAAAQHSLRLASAAVVTCMRMLCTLCHVKYRLDARYEACSSCRHDRCMRTRMY